MTNSSNELVSPQSKSADLIESLIATKDKRMIFYEDFFNAFFKWVIYNGSQFNCKYYLMHKLHFCHTTYISFSF